MGAGWYVARERSGPAMLPHKGKALLFAQFQLEELASAQAVPPLKDFFSSDPAALTEFFEKEGIDPSQFDLAEEQWHDAADALPTVRLLLDCVRDDPGAIQSANRVVADLDAMLEILEDAAAAGERFHIATVMPDLPHEKS